jgi:hypothetical protein
MLKKTNVQILIGVAIIVAVLVGGYFIIAGSAKKPKTVSEGPDNTVHTLSAKAIGLEMEAKPNGTAVKFTIKKAEGIKTLEYQLNYEADSTAQERSEGGEARVERGVTGEADIDAGESTYESPWIDLGSCSNNVCRYDKGVDSVDLTLKIVKTDKKIYQVEDSLEL